jgi:N-methylhydantoinase A/oxoprolinase/acetone carboxylase beta subunit
LEIVVDREHLGIPLESLTRRGEVLLCGFTPSDAAHVLGLQAEWSRDAAWLGARIEARKEAIAGQAPATTPESFAAAVLDAARAASTRALVAATWPTSGGHPATLERLAEDPLFAAVVAGRRAGRPLALAVELDRPVVAVGGPAAIFYDGVPERLGSRLVLPPHFAVCNAVGAVVGDVVVRVERVATRISEERLALYLGENVVEVTDVAAARVALAEDARIGALAAAAAFGAVEPMVSVAIEEDRAQLAGGLELVVEIRARAIASGRPRATTTLSR